MFKLFARKKQEVEETPEDRIRDFWDQEAFLEFAALLFKKHQRKWNNLDVHGMKQYMTEDFYRHHLLILKALQNSGRHYEIEDVQVLSAEIYKKSLSAGSITVLLNAKSTDRLINTKGNEVLYTRSSPFLEYWHFKDSDDGWKLNGVSQIASRDAAKRHEYKKYAASRNLYYSNDFGWLLLPQKGELFKKASFKKSGVSNHMIGFHNNSVIQLYHYAPKKSKKKQRYLVAEAELPDSYGHLVGKRHGKHNWLIPRFFRKPRGLEYVSTKGADFNKQYEIYASNPKKAEHLALLGHHYMQRLLTISFNVTFEVVDDTLYLYTQEALDNFEPMYVLLEEALTETHGKLISVHE